MSFIKWVGGKSQIINDVFELYPKIINNYYEPFLGGGSVLIELLNKLENNEIKLLDSIYCSDINKNLINCYNFIKSNPNELILELDKLSTFNKQNQSISNKSKYKSVSIPSNINDAIKNGNDILYYYLRDKYNKLDLTLEKAALFIYLNKTCFRGLYREGKNGFNVPYGNYKNPQLYDKEYIVKLSNLFNKYKVNFTTNDFEYIYDVANELDFCYFDPPYYPINNNSFVDYNIDGFNKHENLINLILTLHMIGAKFLLSNSNTKYITDNLKEFNIKVILCKRSINSTNPNSTAEEVLIYN